MAGSWIALVEGFGGFKVSKTKSPLILKYQKNGKAISLIFFTITKLLISRLEEDSILISAENTKELNIENLSSKRISYE